MKALKTLGTYDEDGHVLEEPVYSFGPVIERGLNLPSGKNHVDYIDSKGYYDIIKYNLDHEEYFPAMGVTVVGKLGPHLTTEVDCESLFSQTAGTSLIQNGVEPLLRLLKDLSLESTDFLASFAARPKY